MYKKIFVFVFLLGMTTVFINTAQAATPCTEFAKTGAADLGDGYRDGLGMGYYEADGIVCKGTGSPQYYESWGEMVWQHKTISDEYPGTPADSFEFLGTDEQGKAYVAVDGKVMGTGDQNISSKGFVVLNSYYQKNDETVYCRNKKLTDTDPEEFKVVTQAYGADSDQLYFQCDPVEAEIDFETLTGTDHYTANDKNNVYYNGTAYTHDEWEEKTGEIVDTNFSATVDLDINANVTFNSNDTGGSNNDNSDESEKKAALMRQIVELLRLIIQLQQQLDQQG